jgi:hypothetical protein
MRYQIDQDARLHSAVSPSGTGSYTIVSLLSGGRRVKGRPECVPFTTTIFFGPCNWVLIPFQAHLHTHLVA